MLSLCGIFLPYPHKNKHKLLPVHLQKDLVFKTFPVIIMHQEIKDRIIHLLQEIVDRTHSICKPGCHDIEIEVDMAMEDIRQLYREYDLLRRNQAPETTKAPVTDTTEEVVRTPHIGPKQVVVDLAPMSEAVTEDSIPKILQQPDQIIAQSQTPEPLAEPRPANEVVARPPAPSQEAHVIKTEPGLVNPKPAKATDAPNNGNRGVVDLFAQDAPRSVGENFAREDNSLHKKIVAQKEDRSIGTRLQMTPVASLKDAIGVNEKFLFINELFGGNILVYNEAIARLNSFENMQMAFDYLNELSMVLVWDQNRSGQAIEKLANFVQRRYIDRK